MKSIVLGIFLASICTSVHSMELTKKFKSLVSHLTGNNTPNVNQIVIAIMYSNNEDLKKYLLHKDPPINQEYLHMYYPVHCAVLANNTIALELLLKAGADPNKQANIDNRTPSHCAIYEDNRDALRILLLHKANVEVEDNAGLNLLGCAQQSGKQKVIQIIDRYKAN